MRTRLWLALAFTAGAFTLLSTGCAVGVGAYGYEGPGYYEAYGPGPVVYGGGWAPGWSRSPTGALSRRDWVAGSGVMTSASGFRTAGRTARSRAFGFCALADLVSDHLVA